MRILVYTPTNSRAVDLQSVMELFMQLGHEVYLLSQLPEGDLHLNVKKYGVKVSGNKDGGRSGILSYYRNYRAVTEFIKQNRIEIVFAHLQGAGLVTGIANLFYRFRLVYVRHNTDEHILQKSWKAGIINWLTNLLAPLIIAPSEKVYRYLIEVEKVKPSKIIRINYGYNFNQYLETDKAGNGEDIRNKYKCNLLLVSVARLLPVKRHLLMFDVVRRLKNEGMDVKMICLGEGSYRLTLEEYIRTYNLNNEIFLQGNKKNVFDYLEASDIFFHLSASEASNSAVKEAGFCGKTVIVCNDVGDFEDYIKDSINGFIADKNEPVERSFLIIKNLYENQDILKVTGKAIKKTIYDEFDISRVKEKYIELLAAP